MSDCAIFIVPGYVLRLILHNHFSNLFCVLASVKLGGNTEYVLMGFTVLSVLTISSNTGSSY